MKKKTYLTPETECLSLGVRDGVLASATQMGLFGAPEDKDHVIGVIGSDIL